MYMYMYYSTVQGRMMFVIYILHLSAYFVYVHCHCSPKPIHLSEANCITLFLVCRLSFHKLQLFVICVICYITEMSIFQADDK